MLRFAQSCRCQRAAWLAAALQHSLPATFSRDSECSLAARRAGENCGHVLEAPPLRSIAGIGHGGSAARDNNHGRAGLSGRSIGRGIACSTT